MEITGKAKRDFIEWFYDSRDNYRCSEGGLIPIAKFQTMPLSMRWGVYQDFFNSIGIDIQNAMSDHFAIQSKTHDFLDKDGFLIRLPSLTNRESAIKAANKIYNENK